MDQEEKKRRKLIKEQLKNGTYVFKSDVAFDRPEGMSDEEYTRKIVEMEAEICGIAPASPRINGPITGQISRDFYSDSNTPQIKTGPRGGKYTLGRTKNGRPYRRYF